MFLEVRATGADEDGITMSHGTSGGSGRNNDGRSPCVVLATFACVGFVLGAGAVGCDGDKKPMGDARPPVATSSSVGVQATPSATASASASVLGAASASASASSSAAAPPAEPQGTGVSGFVAVGSADACKTQTGQVADYLQRGEVALAGHDGAIAAAWLIKLSPSKPDAQLA